MVQWAGLLFSPWIKPDTLEWEALALLLQPFAQCFEPFDLAMKHDMGIVIPRSFHPDNIRVRQGRRQCMTGEVGNLVVTHANEYGGR